MLFQLIAPKLLRIIDKKMSHQQSFRYAILKGYIQGEIDAMNIIDEIATSKQVKEVSKILKTRKGLTPSIVLLTSSIVSSLCTFRYHL